MNTTANEVWHDEKENRGSEATDVRTVGSMLLWSAEIDTYSRHQLFRYHSDYEWLGSRLSWLRSWCLTNSRCCAKWEQHEWDGWRLGPDAVDKHWKWNPNYSSKENKNIYMHIYTISRHLNPRWVQLAQNGNYMRLLTKAHPFNKLYRGQADFNDSKQSLPPAKAITLSWCSPVWVWHRLCSSENCSSFSRCRWGDAQRQQIHLLSFPHGHDVSQTFGS